MLTLRFHAGTLVVEGAAANDLPPGFVDDDRIGAARGPACLYRPLVLQLVAQKAEFQDQARAYERLDDLVAVSTREPRSYQAEALAAWEAAGRRGVVVLPTGAGKTFVAELAILSARRPTLVVAPTLDLVGQWYSRLKAAFGRPVGMLGGGHHDVQELTVSTYDSAWLHLSRYGDRFGLLVFDEVHHLPAPAYRTAAEAAIAPFRLGLTATWERDDGRHLDLDDVVGPVVYRKDIQELAGEFLADYDTVRLLVQLGPGERLRYEELWACYRGFIEDNRISMRGPDGWTRFMMLAARSPEGRAALRAHRDARAIAHGTTEKIALLASLLREERGRRTIIFTHDNKTALHISRTFLVPCITHQTDVLERRALLDGFEAGTLPVLATSRVLNEGVDLPAAEIAIVLSGTGTVREHVQRLGRILRPGHGKRATLYEIVAANTSEERTSERRRQHDAYR